MEQQTIKGIEPETIGLLEAEIQHQYKKWGEFHIKNQTVEAHLLILQKELDEAIDGWMKNKTGRDSVESELIQVTAVAINAVNSLVVRKQQVMVPKGV